MATQSTAKEPLTESDQPLSTSSQQESDQQYRKHLLHAAQEVTEYLTNSINW